MDVLKPQNSSVEYDLEVVRSLIDPWSSAQWLNLVLGTLPMRENEGKVYGSLSL